MLVAVSGACAHTAVWILQAPLARRVRIRMIATNLQDAECLRIREGENSDDPLIYEAGGWGNGVRRLETTGSVARVELGEGVESGKKDQGRVGAGKMWTEDIASSWNGIILAYEFVGKN